MRVKILVLLLLLSILTFVLNQSIPVEKAIKQEPIVLVPYTGLSLDEVSELNIQCNKKGLVGSLELNDDMQVISVTCGRKIKGE